MKIMRTPALLRRRWVADIAIAAVVGLVACVGVWSELAAANRPGPPASGAFALTVLAAALLVAGRRAALLVSVAVFVLCLAYHLLGYAGEALALAEFPALYSLTCYGSGLPSLVEAGVLSTATGFLTVLPPHSPGFLPGAQLGVLTGMLAAASVGEAARVRRVAAGERVRQASRRAREEAWQRVTGERLAIARELHDVLPTPSR